MSELQGRGIGSSTIQRSTFRTEALLRAAERGSVGHIERLGQWREWPNDFPGATRALLILFEHLKANVTAIPELETCRQPELLGEPTVVLIEACLDSINGLLGYIRETSKENVDKLFAIVRANLEYYFAWLAFFGRNSPCAPGYYTGYNYGAQRIMLLLDQGIHYADDPDTHERVADFCLSLWMIESASPRVDGAVFTVEEYWENVFIKFDGIWRCTAHEPTRNQVVRRVSAFNDATLKVLASSLYRELVDWPATHMHEYHKNPTTYSCQPLIRYIQTATMLCNHNSRFFQIILEMRFATRAFKLAWELRHAQSLQPYGGTVAGEIANLLFGPMVLLSKESPRLIPELLEAGLLDILAFELLSQPPEGRACKFDKWYSIGDGLNPLKTLLHFCHHPRVSAALRVAMDQLPAETRDALARNVTANGYWKPFSDDFIFYRMAVEILPHRAGRFCDSLEHHTKQPGEQTEVAKQCSWCHTTMYCSRECQAEDWESFHKRECSRDRLQRIERELSGTWVSHRSRLFKLIYLQVAISKCQRPEKPPGVHFLCPIIVADATVLPMRMYELDGTDKRFGFDKIETDTRSVAMIRRCAGDPTKLLAIAVSGFGRRRVNAVALFSVPTLQLLSGYVRQNADESVEIPVKYLVHRRSARDA